MLDLLQPWQASTGRSPCLDYFINQKWWFHPLCIELLDITHSGGVGSQRGAEKVPVLIPPAPSQAFLSYNSSSQAETEHIWSYSREGRTRRQPISGPTPQIHETNIHYVTVYLSQDGAAQWHHSLQFHSWLICYTYSSFGLLYCVGYHRWHFPVKRAVSAKLSWKESHFWKKKKSLWRKCPQKLLKLIQRN